MNHNKFGNNFVHGGVYYPKPVPITNYASNQSTQPTEPENHSQSEKEHVQQNNIESEVSLHDETEQEKSDVSLQNEMDKSMSSSGPESKGSFTRMHFKQIFLTRKKSSVRAKERKIRQNRQLRRAIFPKNALMALNEVKGITTSDFVITSCESGFSAIVTVNGNQYEGKGTSKVAAKNNACEKALRDYVIMKMTLKPRNPKNTPQNSEEMVVDNGGDSDSTMDSQKPALADDDDVPMVNLASFALYKLFVEWEKEGFTVPELHPETQNGASETEKNSPKEAKKTTIRTELPIGWENMHPATVLCMMRPGVTYTDCSNDEEIDKPNVMQHVSVIVDGLDFRGSGRSKKIARRNAAVAVCNAKFGTNYSIEEFIMK